MKIGKFSVELHLGGRQRQLKNGSARYKMNIRSMKIELGDRLTTYFRTGRKVFR